MDRLLPDPAAGVSVEDQLAGFEPVAGAHESRPYTYSNFVVTVDGRASIRGRSGPIGSDVDTAMLVGLRMRADAVLVGAGTLRAEGYGRVIVDPQKRTIRERRGLPHDPLMVLVSSTLDLPWDVPLFTCGAGRVLLFTSSEESPPETATSMRVVRHRQRVDLVEALRHLRVERGIRSLLCEGGAILHGQLVALGLLDELFLTTGPLLAGGIAPTLLEGTPEDPRPLELEWLLRHESELFARYRLAAAD